MEKSVETKRLEAAIIQFIQGLADDVAHKFEHIDNLVEYFGLTKEDMTYHPKKSLLEVFIEYEETNIKSEVGKQKFSKEIETEMATEDTGAKRVIAEELKNNSNDVASRKSVVREIFTTDDENEANEDVVPESSLSENDQNISVAEGQMTERKPTGVALPFKQISDEESNNEMDAESVQHDAISKINTKKQSVSGEFTKSTKGQDLKDDANKFPKGRSSSSSRKTGSAAAKPIKRKLNSNSNKVGVKKCMQEFNFAAVAFGDIPVVNPPTSESVKSSPTFSGIPKNMDRPGGQSLKHDSNLKSYAAYNIKTKPANFEKPSKDIKESKKLTTADLNVTLEDECSAKPCRINAGTSKKPEINWVQCDKCTEWYHTICKFGYDGEYTEAVYRCGC